MKPQRLKQTKYIAKKPCTLSYARRAKTISRQHFAKNIDNDIKEFAKAVEKIQRQYYSRNVILEEIHDLPLGSIVRKKLHVYLSKMLRRKSNNMSDSSENDLNAIIKISKE